MSRPRYRVFKEKKALQSLIKLRRKGYTYQSLAFIFGVDHSSVYHHCKNVKSTGHRVFELPNILSAFQVDTGEILSLLHLYPKYQKTYAEYLAESNRRNAHKFLNFND